MFSEPEFYADSENGRLKLQSLLVFGEKSGFLFVHS